MPKTKSKTQIEKNGPKVNITSLGELVDIQEISRSNCKFCQSKIRHEAEELFEQTNNIKATYNLLNSKGDEVTYLAVRNHLHRHYLGGIRQLAIMEWSEDVENYADNYADRRKLLLERIAIMRREMCIIASASDIVDMDNRRKNADVIKKLSDGIIALELRLDDIDSELEPIEIVIENLKNILARKIGEVSTEAAKRALMDVLNELSTNIAELFKKQEENA